jgi:uncharacterized protein YxeA
MVLNSIRNFRIEFSFVNIIIIFLIGAAVIAIPNIAYSQPSPYVPNTENINNANNKAVV